MEGTGVDGLPLVTSQVLAHQTAGITSGEVERQSGGYASSPDPAPLRSGSRVSRQSPIVCLSLNVPQSCRSARAIISCLFDGFN